jgi:hypothetical protein
MTMRIKGSPSEVLLASQSRSAVLADHVKNLDWRALTATRKGKISDSELAEVRGKLRALAGMTAGFSSRNMPIGRVISAGTFVMMPANVLFLQASGR